MMPIISTEQMLGKTEQHLHYFTDKVAVHIGMVNAYKALAFAAKTDGIQLSIASGFRSFERQLTLWNNKFSGKSAIKDSLGNIINTAGLSSLDLIESILLYSALPGASRHHWGCDIDVYAPNLLAEDYQLQLEPWEYEKQGPLAKLSTWLAEHAHLYGFYFPYADYQGGVAKEPWHLSYAPLAKQYQQAFNQELLAQALQNSATLGKEIIIKNLADISNRYINNVNEIPANVILTQQ